VAALNLDGVGFLKETRRFYPKTDLAAHLLGWVGLDSNGLSGLEFAYDAQIRGKPGAVLVQTDAKRHAFSRFERPPTSGATAALEDHVMPADELIDTNPGQIRIGSRVVRENEGHNYHVLSLTDVIVKSSNVGAIKIGFKVGTERLSRYVAAFGFGHPVSPDFP